MNEKEKKELEEDKEEGKEEVDDEFILIGKFKNISFYISLTI